MSQATLGEYDVIVIGVGGMGSAACHQLARRGQRVLGLERFDIPHAMGSSHGVTRIIRLAYYEDPSYVPLLRRAYELWRELERESGEQLLHITGSIDASDADGDVFKESLRSCLLHDLTHEVLTSRELSTRFPGFHLPDGHMALLQPDGGFLLSERCIVAHVEAAIEAGAEIHGRERVLGWESTDSGVIVDTDRSRYRAGKIVVSPGAWIGEIMPDLAPLVRPERQVLAWLQPTRRDLFLPEQFPVFNLTVAEGRYYGFPIFGIPGVKLGRYHHLDETIDPEDWDREPNRADEAIIRAFAERYLPEATGPAMTLKSCIFTNSPDEHFIIDALPGDERVIVASPCSGHGFKFCTVIGEILADLAIDGATRHDISLFRLDRFTESPLAVR
jgi:sarcosine oxidase